MDDPMIIDDVRGVDVRMLPVSLIVPNEWNPNEMDAFTLDQLAKDVTTSGFLQPILVVPQDNGKYRIIDGEHRFEVARLCDMERVPVIVMTSEDVRTDEDWQKFQTVRMNRLRGKLNKKKFDALIQSLAERHSVGELASNLVFEDTSYIDELLAKARESLPTEDMRKEFDRSKDDVKTIDDLTVLLNRLYSRYGDTLDYGYMVFDFGGKDHLWVRINNKEDFLFLKEKADLVRSMGYSFPSALMLLLRSIDNEFLNTNSTMIESVYTEDYRDGV